MSGLSSLIGGATTIPAAGGGVITKKGPSLSGISHVPKTNQPGKNRTAKSRQQEGGKQATTVAFEAWLNSVCKFLLILLKANFLAFYIFIKYLEIFFLISL